MLMSELVHPHGVPVATLKFYLREGLLHPGRRTLADAGRLRRRATCGAWA